MNGPLSERSCSPYLAVAQPLQARQPGAAELSVWSEALFSLAARIHSCSACQHLRGVAKVFSPKNGSSYARCVIVAEAPGRFGAGRYMIPLYGDATGRNFDLLLESAGLSRSELFITNAVLCNPRSPRGTNRSPRTEEVASCSSHLAKTLALLDPPMVVSLGAIALRSLSHIAPHSYSLRTHVGQVLPWHGRVIIPLYHPSPRARVHRGLRRQIQDFKKVALVLRGLDGSGGIGKGRKEVTQVGNTPFDLCVTG